MPIEHKSGATVLTGDSIDFYVLASLKGAVGLELKGMRMSRGRSACAVAKERYGLKGNKQKVYDQLCTMVEEQRKVQEHRTVENGREIREVEGKEVN